MRLMIKNEVSHSLRWSYRFMPTFACTAQVLAKFTVQPNALNKKTKWIFSTFILAHYGDENFSPPLLSSHRYLLYSHHRVSILQRLRLHRSFSGGMGQMGEWHGGECEATQQNTGLQRSQSLHCTLPRLTPIIAYAHNHNLYFCSHRRKKSTSSWSCAGYAFCSFPSCCSWITPNRYSRCCSHTTHSPSSTSSSSGWPTVIC